MWHFNFKTTALGCLLVTGWGLSIAPHMAQAQTLAQKPSLPLTIATAFEAAWALQPEAQSLNLRKQALAEHASLANNWSPEPAAIELSSATDRFSGNQGGRVYGVAVSLPLWLPGQKQQSKALIEVQRRGLEATLQSAKLKLAEVVRETFWEFQRAQSDFDLAKDRLKSATRIASDVSQRVKAGDLARADQHQADLNLASAEVYLAQSEQVALNSHTKFKTLIGFEPGSRGPSMPTLQLTEPLPNAASVDRGLLQLHPAITSLNAQAEIAQQTARLESIQNRTNPELGLGLNRERGAFGETYQNKLSLNIRIPLGSSSRASAKAATANADLLELEVQTRLVQERLTAGFVIAQQNSNSAERVVEAYRKRARLAHETRGFFEKSFRLGEADLPTRLRAELEAVEADRQLARGIIDYAATVSALRHALGILPE
jgi:outer membrane protein, heavy metal efflux system